jgi:hypothetical protein
MHLAGIIVLVRVCAAGDAELKAWAKVQRPFLADDGSGLPLLCFRCARLAAVCGSYL